MRALWIDKIITYDGKQLCSHWIHSQSGETQDAIASFIGPADVPISNMVDLEDVKNNAPIFSKSMLHFIVEHFDGDLFLAIARQRLLVATTFEYLTGLKVLDVLRCGDDIFIKNKKLSVSIATASPVSTLIHFALNISSEGTPVPTVGLDDIKINPKHLAEEIMRRYCSEIESMHTARCKVRIVD